MENASLTHLQVFGIANEEIGIVANPETVVILAICVPPIEECVENFWGKKRKGGSIDER